MRPGPFPPVHSIANLLSVTRVWLCMFLLATLAKAEESPGPGSKSVESTPSVWNSGALGAQANQLEKEYGGSGRVTRLRPRLVHHENEQPIVLPPAAIDPSSKGCTTVSVLTAPNISFLLVFPHSEDDPRRRTWPIPSAAGSAEVTRCGARKSLLSGLSMKLRSRRGVAEFVVLESENPPPPVSELLPARNPGPSLPSPQVGRRPWLAPLKQRLEAIRKSLRETGAEAIHESGLASDASGSGSAVVHLDPGCHRLQLLVESNPEAPPDLDGRLSDLARGTEIAVDEEHRGQVSLSYCVGRAERVRLDYSGALPSSEVILVHSTWSIPEAFPTSWGPLARARLAQAAWEGGGLQHFGVPPVYSSLGVRGTTRLTIPVDPSYCYVALLAPIRGEATSLALGTRAMGSTSEAHSTDGPGVAVSFCARGTSRALLEAQALGASVAWILGVWETGRVAP